MIDDTISGLSNHAYHYEKPYSDSLSSSSLKHYLKSAKYAKYMLDNPDGGRKSAEMAFGSLFHDFMASLACANGVWGTGYACWLDKTAVFQPPVNDKTGAAYGAASKPYKEAYEAFLAENTDKTIASEADVEMCLNMANSLLHGCGEVSEQVRKLLKWGVPEVSHFVEYEGLGFKYRPDLETKLKIVDWKTVSADDLGEDSVNKIISKFGYDISAAFYQFMEHERSGVWKDFYLVMVSKQPPYDCVMVDMSNWSYRIDGEEAYPCIGAMKMRSLLDQHIYCTKNGCWEGACNRIMPDMKGRRIMVPEPPAYENWKQINFYNNQHLTSE